MLVKYQLQRTQHPDSVPVLLHAISSQHRIEALQARYQRMLVRKNMTHGQLLHRLRQACQVNPREALVVLYGTDAPVLPTPATLMSQIDRQFTEEDGAVHATYTLENTFG